MNICDERTFLNGVELDKVYDIIKEAANEQHIDHSSIGKCCNGRQKTANGYRWEFL